MSDAFYQQRAARRTRMGCAVGGAVVLVLLALFGLWSLFHDACTGSFDRSPETVVRSFLDAVRRGDQPRAQQCWEHYAYFDLGAGCSEICLSKVLGASFQVTGVSVQEVEISPQGRANHRVVVSIACDGGEAKTADIVLDSVRQDLPWRHWAIVRSTFGGTVAEPWCVPGRP